MEKDNKVALAIDLLSGSRLEFLHGIQKQLEACDEWPAVSQDRLVRAVLTAAAAILRAEELNASGFPAHMDAPAVRVDPITKRELIAAGQRQGLAAAARYVREDLHSLAPASIREQLAGELEKLEVK